MESPKDISRRFVQAYKLLLERGKVADKKDFATQMGISASLLTEITKERSNVGARTLQKIVQLFGVSGEWLLTGVGEPWDTTGSGSPKNLVAAAGGIPLIPVDAMAGFGHGEATVLEAECERYYVPAFRGADFLITVSGDSMAPHFLSGDVVACKYLPLSDLFFQWGKTYVIDTEQGALIKRVGKGSHENTITLISDNPAYEPFEMRRSGIRHIALVLGIIRNE
ncbi:MAG: helix-turn-helix domain-containing protein [Bacteroidaceae bacterium]|nr:helix-turn-helix domain-containing protein [Bacteroidaceae bacterium]